MLQNKIYQNFFIEIIKTFLVILFGLTIIALTVRAVNFLELIVDSGYPPSTYFKYSFLNLFGCLKSPTKSLILGLSIFIEVIFVGSLTHKNNFVLEFCIYLSGEK